MNLSASSYYVPDSSSMQYLNYGAGVSEASPSIFPQKPFFCSQNKKNKDNRENTFGSQFFIF